MSQFQDSIRIVDAPLLTGDAVAAVTDPNAGGIAVFVGTTRAEESDGRKLIALHYEAFEEMAMGQFAELAAGARSQWPVLRVALWHRIGRVAIGEPSVIVAVSTPHRAESFEACRWIIDELKRFVTIWKQDVWDDGGETWKL